MADNVTLFAFTAERRPCSNRSIPWRLAPTANPQKRPGGTDVAYTDTRQFHRPCSAKAYYASSANNAFGEV